MNHAFAAFMVLTAILASVSRTHRSSTLFLWATGLGAGALFLGLGFEVLALVQWIASSLVALGSFFFLVAFDEEENRDARPLKHRLLSLIPPALAGFGFVAAVVFALLPLQTEPAQGPLSPRGIEGLGQAMVSRHLISVEILAFLLFVGLIGGGVILRPFLKRRSGA